jgi:hypothetical protein
MWIMLWHQEPWGVIPHEQQKERARATGGNLNSVSENKEFTHMKKWEED